MAEGGLDYCKLALSKLHQCINNDAREDPKFDSETQFRI